MTLRTMLLGSEGKKNVDRTRRREGKEKKGKERLEAVHKGRVRARESERKRESARGEKKRKRRRARVKYREREIESRRETERRRNRAVQRPSKVSRLRAMLPCSIRRRLRERKCLLEFAPLCAATCNKVPPCAREREG